MTTGAFPDKVINVTVRKPERAGQKARIHSGAVGCKQPGSHGPGTVPHPAVQGQIEGN
jgi:hypothetical protein